VYPPIIAKQWLSKSVTVATNTHATIEELLDTSFPMQSVLYQRKVGNLFFPELLAYFILFTKMISSRRMRWEMHGVCLGAIKHAGF
jgi:hypothetical protein